MVLRFTSYNIAETICITLWRDKLKACLHGTLKCHIDILKLCLNELEAA